jgi:glycosyltransferase 2 family protein
MSNLPGKDDKAPGKEPPPPLLKVRTWHLGSWQLWLGIVFSLVFLVLALRGVDLRETANALRRVNYLILCAAVASYIFSAVAKAIRWQLLLSLRKTPSFGRAFSVLFIGFMVNAFLPTRLGEFARAYLMGEAEADSKIYVLGTIAVEKVSDILTLLLLMSVLLLKMALPDWLAGPARGTALAFAIVVPGFILLVWQRDFVLRMLERIIRFVPLAWREWLINQTRNGLASLDVIRRPLLLLGLFGMSIIVWTICAFTNYLVFLAMNLIVPVWASLLLLVVLQIGTAVPSSPGSIGVFQYLTILTLSIFGLDKNVALGYSLVLYLVVYVPIALLGIWGLWHEKITWGNLTEAAVRFSKGRKKWTTREP